MAPPTGPLLDLTEVAIPGRVGPLSWRVERGQHWALLGPNGAGKSSLLAIAGAVRHPTRGRAVVLGEMLGRTDVRALRSRIGTVDPAREVPGELTLVDHVLTGHTGTVLPLWRTYGPDEIARARALLDLVGLSALAERRFDQCSQGERARARLARALMRDPELLLLDEPAAGLDLAGRAVLMAALVRLAADRATRATVTVTHHLEEMAPTTTHVLLLRAGTALAAGPASDVLTSPLLSAAFGVPLRVVGAAGRWHADLDEPVELAELAEHAEHAEPAEPAPEGAGSTGPTAVTQ
jgi:iron complex transport system ATP-binding protein